MDILYQHRSLADGAEGVHIQEMIDAFRSLGHSVSVYGMAASREPVRGLPTLLGAIRRRLPRPLVELGLLAFNVVEYVRFGRALRRRRPDLVYKRHAMCDVGVILAAKRARVPLVLEVNCPYSSPNCQRFEPNWFRSLVRWCERTAVAEATLVVTVSTPLKQLLQQVTPRAAAAVVVPNGANPERFHAGVPARHEIRARLGADEAVVVGWAGILREWHRVELLLEAAAAIPGLHVLVVGDGPDRARLEDLVSKLALTGRVHFTGRIPHDDMAGYIAALDIAVVADDRTGFASPMKMLEYMAMARAVVAPRIPNVADVVEDGRDAALFTPGDPRDLAAVLKRLADSPELRARLGHEARAKVERERNWRRNAEVVLGALERSRVAGLVGGGAAAVAPVASSGSP